MVIFDKWLMDFDKLLEFYVNCLQAYEHKFYKCSIREIWLQKIDYVSLIPVDYC